MKRAALLPSLLLALVLHGAEPSALKLARTIALPGVKGRFDHFALDIKGGRLFIAALANNSLEALDLAAGKRIMSVSGLGKPTGVLFLFESKRLFVACGDEGVLKVLNGGALRIVKSIGELEDADNIRYDAKSGLIYLGYGDGALAVVRAKTAEKIASIKLAGHPESFQLEKTGNRIFVNVPDAKQIAVVERDKQVVAATWPMEDFKANFPMALDEADHRLFVGCRNPARLVVFDTESGRRVADVAISGDIDDLFYDAARRRLYASCGEGFIDIIAQLEIDRYERREQIPTSPGARTAFFSPERGEFYLAVPDPDGKKAEIRVFEII